MYLVSLDDHSSQHALYRGSDMSAHVLMNLLNELRKKDKIRGLSKIFLFFATCLIN